VLIIRSSVFKKEPMMVVVVVMMVIVIVMMVMMMIKVALQPRQVQDTVNMVPQPKLVRLRSRWLASCLNTHTF
jgi:hypothetical protein